MRKAKRRKREDNALVLAHRFAFVLVLLVRNPCRELIKVKLAVTLEIEEAHDHCEIVVVAEKRRW